MTLIETRRTARFRRRRVAWRAYSAALRLAACGGRSGSDHQGEGSADNRPDQPAHQQSDRPTIMVHAGDGGKQHASGPGCGQAEAAGEDRYLQSDERFPTSHELSTPGPIYGGCGVIQRLAGLQIMRRNLATILLPFMQLWTFESFS